MTLLDAIPVGRAHAKKKAQIALRLGWTTRAVEKAIEEARKSGKAAICSDSEVGYWMASTIPEYRQNIQARQRRALGQLLTVRGEKRALRAWEARDAVPLVFMWGES